MTLELFRCVPYAAKLTRASCAKKHSDARAIAPRSITLLGREKCVACEVGAAHARGERPDVEIARLTAAHEHVELPRPAPGVGSKDTDPAPRARLGTDQGHTQREPLTLAPKETTMSRPAEQFEVDGVTKTISEWADQLGVSRTMIDKRKRAGQSVEFIVRELLRGDREHSREGAKPAAAKPAAAKPAAAKPAATPTLVDEVRAVLRSGGLFELAKKLGYDVEDLGEHPSGRLFLERSAATGSRR